jgi:flagellar motor switch protein FliG
LDVGFGRGGASLYFAMKEKQITSFPTEITNKKKCPLKKKRSIIEKFISFIKNSTRY